MLIGPKLKVLRKNEGHSLRKLAELSDVTVGTLSQIENDKTSPRWYSKACAEGIKYVDGRIF